MAMKKLIAILTAILMTGTLCACGRDTVAAPAPTEAPPAEIEFGKATDSGEDWRSEFEASLLEQYGVAPERYEDLGGGIYQVYVLIDGNSVPFVTVDSATGDYHG